MREGRPSRESAPGQFKLILFVDKRCGSDDLALLHHNPFTIENGKSFFVGDIHPVQIVVSQLGCSWFTAKEELEELPEHFVSLNDSNTERQSYNDVARVVELGTLASLSPFVAERIVGNKVFVIQTQFAEYGGKSDARPIRAGGYVCSRRSMPAATQLVNTCTSAQRCSRYDYRAVGMRVGWGRVGLVTLRTPGPSFR